MGFNLAADRPLLYVVFWRWTDDFPNRMVMCVDEHRIVKETRCRWYLERETRIGNTCLARFVDKNYPACLYSASLDRAAAIRQFCARERIEAERYRNLAEKIESMIAGVDAGKEA